MPVNPPGSITPTEPYETASGPPGEPVWQEWTATRDGLANVTHHVSQPGNVLQEAWFTQPRPVADVVGPYRMDYGQRGAAGGSATRFGV